MFSIWTFRVATKCDLGSFELTSLIQGWRRCRRNFLQIFHSILCVGRSIQHLCLGCNCGFHHGDVPRGTHIHRCCYIVIDTTLHLVLISEAYQRNYYNVNWIVLIALWVSFAPCGLLCAYIHQARDSSSSSPAASASTPSTSPPSIQLPSIISAAEPEYIISPSL